ncbi:replication-relaxation family protein [Candidatus Uabimicrobium sp. HlEnr_7]|uniref:replication-relaxation family protein n=1 Tax=Candidatus Uabimicrobium helgolandensis TaxID=3095367 RepID=UPI0035580C84
MNLDTPLSHFILQVLEQPAFQIGLNTNEVTELFCADQGKEYTDSSYKSISRRLGQMYKAKVLQRFKPENKYCYYLNQKALAAIRQWAHNHELKPRPNVINTIVHSRLGASSIAKIVCASLRSGEIDSYFVLDGFDVEISDNEKEKKCLRPDALLQMNKQTFAIEIDANTESKTQLEEKLIKYLIFLNREINQEIRVLFIATHFQRTKMIFSILREIFEGFSESSVAQIANRIYFSYPHFLDNSFQSGWVKASIERDITTSDFITGIMQ